MRFGTVNVCGLYKLGSLRTAARELAKYKLDLVGTQENMWEKVGTVRAWDCIFSMKKKTKIINCKQDFLYTTEYQQLR